MKHASVLKLNSPIEFIESSKISPFVSKVQIKVCYVGDEPNRNRSIITKKVAEEMAPSLRGCPIVGFYNESKGDYEEHNFQINVSNGEWKLTDTTVPYGFIDLNAKIWFATYIDDNKTERTYLCTEGYIWDHTYPEAKRILTKGNNQSMEFDEDTLDAFWTKDKNKRPEFFIVNEAFISKLCILGEDCEPCFEGSQISKFSLVIDEKFQNKMYSMMNEIKNLLIGGETKVFTKYAVEIGDALWSALYSYIERTYSDGETPWCSKYSIDGVFEENGQKFAVLCNKTEMKYYRLNFSLSDTEGFVADQNLVEVTKSYTSIAGTQFAAADVETYITEYVKKKEEEDKNKGKTDKEDNKDSEETSEEDEKKDSEDKKEDDSKSTDEDEDKKKKNNKKFSYNSLEEIPEYAELQTKFSELKAQVDSLNATIETLTKEVTPLRDFKAQAERKEKEDMIARFYMLSEEDKKDVVEKIDTYSLDDIEAKLSIICVRNKVSFAEDDHTEPKAPTTFNLDEDQDDDSATPAWVKAALDTAKTLN